MTVGYIGASGLMGHGMVKNLIAKGQKLAITVHKQRDRVKDLLDAGATLADNAAALGASGLCGGDPATQAIWRGLMGHQSVEARRLQSHREGDLFPARTGKSGGPIAMDTGKTCRPYS